ncbi:MAG: formyltetrahydrofolate deformylase [Alphaproteobacteria bacterium]|nr:formyltetrahydrofolate deformylase [Alphaproteobacteria bacterium]
MTIYVLNLVCPDKPGIVAAVSSFLCAQNMNITQSNQFGDADTGRFFMRVGFEKTKEKTKDKANKKQTQTDIEALKSAFAPLGENWAMDWQIYDMAQKPRALILVSKFDHCLVDLLYHTQAATLNMDIVGVFSNHETTRHLVVRENIDFHYQAISAETKSESETYLRRLIDETGAELLILARYMQILSPAFCDNMVGQIINIHHSFLPSFKGAVPYSRAYERGVKMIGATAHYVTSKLDEGPIIAQNVAAVRHDMNVAQMVKTGREVEQTVLIQAVAAHIERRVLLNGHKTVVFT